MTFPPRSARSRIDQVGSGIGAQLTPVPQPGLSYSGVQWYRNGQPISEQMGGQDVPYLLTAADIPAPGAAGVRITCELTGLTAMTLPNMITNP